MKKPSRKYRGRSVKLTIHRDQTISYYSVVAQDVGGRKVNWVRRPVDEVLLADLGKLSKRESQLYWLSLGRRELEKRQIKVDFA